MNMSAPAKKAKKRPKSQRMCDVWNSDLFAARVRYATLKEVEQKIHEELVAITKVWPIEKLVQSGEPPAKRAKVEAPAKNSLWYAYYDGDELIVKAAHEFTPPTSGTICHFDSEEEARTFSKDTLVCYTDGSKTPNRSGYGVYFGPDDPRNQSFHDKEHRTSNHMEAAAVRHALQLWRDTPDREHKRLIIFSDSKLTINVLYEEKWFQKWQETGDTGRKNYAVYKECWDLLSLMPEVEMKKVKAHCGVYGNEEADRLAKGIEL